MEKYEIDVINSKLDHMCINTTAVDQIIVLLKEKSFITIPDAEIIKSQKTNYLKNNIIYEHIMTRSGAMDDFLAILRKTLNTSIADMLEKELKDNKPQLDTEQEKVSDGGNKKDQQPSGVSLNVEGSELNVAGDEVSQTIVNVNRDGNPETSVSNSPDSSERTSQGGPVNITFKGNKSNVAGKKVIEKTINYN